MGPIRPVSEKGTGQSIAFSGTCRLGGAPGTACLGRAFGVNPHRQWNSGRPGPAGATVRQGRELTTLAPLRK
jgi:hypothetical protein